MNRSATLYNLRWLGQFLTMLNKSGFPNILAELERIDTFDYSDVDLTRATNIILGSLRHLSHPSLDALRRDFPEWIIVLHKPVFHEDIGETLAFWCVDDHGKRCNWGWYPTKIGYTTASIIWHDFCRRCGYTGEIW